MDFLLQITWDIDPIMFQLGKLQIRYYGFLFATGIFGGYLLWRWQMMRQGYSEEITEKFVIWAFLAILIGARLGECLLYRFDYYKDHPLEIFMIWRGGLASHGAAVLLAIVIYVYHRTQKVPLLHVCDCFAMPATIPITTVRLGNFMNSEIVGTATNVPWAVKFPQYDLIYRAQMENTGKILDVVARHPSQLYEAIIGVVTFFLLYIIDRHYGKNRPAGLLAAVFLIFYFTARFVIEIYKESYSSPIWGLARGQIFSIPFALAGFYLLFWSLKNKASSLAKEPEPTT